MAIEVRTRGFFLDIADIITKCKFKNSHIEFREACYAFKTKVNRVIRERMEDVFKVDEAKKNEFEHAKFDFCKQFAVKDEKGEPVITQNDDGSSSFRFDRNRIQEANKAVEEWIKKEGWTELVESLDRIAAEKKEWLDKKIKLDVQKVDKFAKIGDFEGTTDGSVMNEQELYSVIASLLCDEEVKACDEDGQEVDD